MEDVDQQGDPTKGGGLGIGTGVGFTIFASSPSKGNKGNVGEGRIIICIWGNQVEVKMFSSTGWELIEERGEAPAVKDTATGVELKIEKRFEFDHSRMTMSVLTRKPDGDVICWGSNLAGECDVPEDIGGDGRDGRRSAIAVVAYGLGSGAWFTSSSTCAADLDRNGVVDGEDLGRLLEHWNDPNPCETDLDADGLVGPSDLGRLLANWGQCFS